MSLLNPPLVVESEDSSVSSYDDRYQQRIVDALALLNVVYDQVNSDYFPLPLETYEAGICKNGQRRYLFTDAFAVMAYQTLADYYMNNEDVPRANLYSRAVERLIDEVHDSLGKPRNRGPASKMKECDISPTGYVGLRSGKPTAKKITDHGTRFDGLFWNHIDKWLFALVRANHIDDGIRIAKSCFPYFFYESIGQGGYIVQKGGIRHKLSVDGTPPPREWDSPMENTYDDTLNALVVFQMLEAKNQHKDVISLEDEIIRLRRILRTSYSWDEDGCFQRNRPQLRSNHDPIEWGMEAIFDQFVIGHPRLSSGEFQMRDQRHIIGSVQHSGRPWLAYAELMGASVYDSSLSEQDFGDLLTLWTYRQPVRYCFMGGHPHENDRKAGMQRVMLAMALLSPGVLKRRTGDAFSSV